MRNKKRRNLSSPGEHQKETDVIKTTASLHPLSFTPSAGPACKGSESVRAVTPSERNPNTKFTCSWTQSKYWLTVLGSDWEAPYYFTHNTIQRPFQGVQKKKQGTCICQDSITGLGYGDATFFSFYGENGIRPAIKRATPTPHWTPQKQKNSSWTSGRADQTCSHSTSAGVWDFRSLMICPGLQTPQRWSGSDTTSWECSAGTTWRSSCWLPYTEPPERASWGIGLQNGTWCSAGNHRQLSQHHQWLR